MPGGVGGVAGAILPPRPDSALARFHREWYGRSGTVKKGGILSIGTRVTCVGVCDDGMAREGMGYEGAMPTGQVFLRVEGMTAEQCELPRHIEWEPN